MKTVILIPTYNERDNIARIVDEVFATVPDVYVRVVDDSSPDGTAHVVEKLIQKYPRLSLMLRPGKEGLGAAYKDAIQRTLADRDVTHIVMMDADGSHDPAYLPSILKASNTHGLVIGSRYVQGGAVEDWERWRYVLSICANWYARILSGIPIHDLTAGFVCVRRQVLEKILLHEISAKGYAYFIEFKGECVRSGASVKEIPIVFKNRREGESKLTTNIAREGVIISLRLFGRRVRQWFSRETFRVFKKHIPALLLSVVIGFVSLAPNLLAIQSMGEDFKGVYPVNGSDDLYYLARHADILDGDLKLSNPYIFEEEPGLEAPFWMTDALLAYGSSILGLDVGEGELLFDAILPIILALLTYTIVHLLTRDILVSLSATIILHFGIFLEAFNRSPSPQINFLFVLLLFLFTILFLKTRRTSYAFLMGATFGILFHVYAYYWTYATIVFGVFALCLLLARQIDKRLFMQALVGILAALPFVLIYIFSLVGLMRDPRYFESLFRLGMIESHFPSGVTIVLFSGVVLALYLLLWWRKIIPIQPIPLFLVSAVLGSAIAVNHHVITGKNHDFPAHYFDVAVFSAIFAIAYAIHAIRIYAPRSRRAIGAVALLCAFFVSLPLAWQTVERQRVASEEEYAWQRYAPVLSWLRENTEAEEVVLARQELSALIPIYTDNNVFYARQANFHFMPDYEVRERFILNNFFENFDEAFVREHEREIFGVHYINRWAHTGNENKVRRILGLPLKEIERLPEGEIEEVVALHSKIKKQGFLAALGKYRVDYVVDDAKDPLPESALSMFERVEREGDFTVYKTR